MKKFIVLTLALATFIGTQSIVQAIDYEYNEDWGYYYVDSKSETSIEQDPMNNDLFEIVATVQSANKFYQFESYNIEYSDDYSKSRIIKKSLGYNGIVKTEAITDFMDHGDVEILLETYNGYAEYIANGYKNPYNDGLIETDPSTRKGSYAYNDTNEAYYIFFDPEWMNYGVGYNLGIVLESWADTIFVPGQDFPEWGEPNTFIYTIFSDDVNYKFLKTDFSIFDDNGYGIMEYNNNQYVIKLKRGYIPTVFYNGEKIKFDQIPVIENGRTLVPLRAIFEKIGAQVEWYGDTQTVVATKDDVSVSLTIDKTTAIKNGEEITLDVPAKIINGRTLVPVRFVSDCFGVDVAWDGTMQRVSLTSK